MPYVNVHRSTLEPGGGVYGCLWKGAREVREIAMRSTETEAGALRMSYSELFNAGATLAANWMN